METRLQNGWPEKSPHSKAIVPMSIRIIGLSGSLRKASLNTALLRAASSLTPKGVSFVVYEGIGTLPLFNPDLEGSEPQTVFNFRDALNAADAVLIASPEYAHGLTGVIKNALDWVVGSSEFSAKPVAILNTAERSHHGWDALMETLPTMDAKVIKAACQTISLTGLDADPEQFANQNDIVNALQLVFAELAQAVERTRAA